MSYADAIRGGTLSKTAEDFAVMTADRAQMLRQEFLAALDQVGENAKQGAKEGSGAKFSIKKSTEGFVFVDVDEDAIDLNDGRSIASVIAELLKERFKNLIAVNRQEIRLNATTNREWRSSHEARILLQYRPDYYNDKMKAIANADEILRVARDWIGEEPKHKKFDEYARGFVYYKVGKNGYKADAMVGLKRDGSATLYDLVNVYEQKITEAPPHAKGVNDSLRSTSGTSVKSSLSQSAENVNSDNVQDSQINAQTDADIDERESIHSGSTRCRRRKRALRRRSRHWSRSTATWNGRSRTTGCRRRRAAHGTDVTFR